MHHNAPTFAPRLFRWDRATASIDLVAGAGTILMPRLPAGVIARLEMIAVTGPAIGGAAVALHADDETRPETFMGAGTVGPADPGITFDAPRPWLYGLERLVVVVTGSAGARAYARVWQRLYFDEYERPPARPEAEPLAEVPEGGETDL